MERRNHNEIASIVMERLGVPPNYFRTVAFQVGVSSYRVNVWVCVPQKDSVVLNHNIAHSFFVTVTPEGLASSPSINQVYERPRTARTARKELIAI